MTSLEAFDNFGGPIQQCVLPLVAKVDDQLFPVGTGFVINASGLFVTAAHVLEEACNKAIRRKGVDGKYYNHYEFYAIYVSDEPLPDIDATVGGLLPIDHVWAPAELDIGFGWLRLPRRLSDNEPLPVYPVRIRPVVPKLETNIVALGYYKMAGSMKVGGQAVIEYAQQTAISKGTIQEVFPEFRDKGMLSFPCFRTDARFEPGMSGAPIFDETGNVLGVVCSGGDSAGDTAQFISHGSLIWPIFGCQVDIAKTPEAPPEKTLLYDLARDGSLLTDDTFDHLSVTTNTSGSRTIRISIPHDVRASDAAK